MAKNTAESYHISVYLCCLVLVGILLTGVSLARYSSSSSVSGDVNIAGLYCSYEIEDMSSLTFSNMDYWQTDENGNIIFGSAPRNTARSVRFVMRNYSVSDSSAASGRADRVSAVDLDGAIRFYAPLEFAENLAVQVAEMNGSNPVVLTPQYVLKDIWSAAEADKGTFKTVDSRDYNDRTDGLSSPMDETLTLSSSSSGAVIAEVIAERPSDEGTVTLSLETGTTRYSVGFMRGTPITVGGETIIKDLEPQLYLDCEKEEKYLTVDISLPEMSLPGGSQTEKTFVLFVTSVKKIVSSDFDWTITDADWDNIFRATEPVKPVNRNDVTITGYHYDREQPLYDASGSPTGKTTTVRISKTLSKTLGGALTFEHVAPLSENAATIVHAMENYYTLSSGSYNSADAPKTADDAQSLYCTCANGGNSGYVSLEGVTENPRRSSFDSQENDYIIAEALGKGYTTRLNVLFVQSSEVPGANA